MSCSDDEPRSTRLRKLKSRATPSSPLDGLRDLESDVDEVASPKKKRLAKKSAIAVLSDSSDAEAHLPVPKRRKLARGKRPTSPRLSEDSGDEVDEARESYVNSLRQPCCSADACFRDT